MRQSTKRVVVWAVAAAMAVLAVAVVPSHWCRRDAPRWFAGDEALQASLAASVGRWGREVEIESFATGSDRFDGEWLFGTHMMAAMGFGQLALEHPHRAREWIDEMDRSLDALLAPASRQFDRAAWSADPLETLAGDDGHAAYLGYANLALSLRRLAGGPSRFDEVGERITEALVRRLERSPNGLLETYPGELYPVDNASVIASIALFDRARGSDHAELVARWVERCRSRWVDPATGLLRQSLAPGLPEHVGVGRGSGTAFAAYFLAFADVELSRELHLAVQRHLAEDVLGFGVVREYPRGTSGGADIDSGPLVFGYSISASGFAAAGCRIHGDEDCFGELFATMTLVGAPHRSEGKLSFVSGGPLADAILFAMLTAPRTGRHE